MVDPAHCFFEIFVFNTDNDIDLAGTLVNHPDVDPAFGQGRKEFGRDSGCVSHANANGCNQRNIMEDFNGVGLTDAVDIGQNLFQFVVEESAIPGDGVIPEGMCSRIPWSDDRQQFHQSQLKHQGFLIR